MIDFREEKNFKKYSDGEVIFNQGDEGDVMYAVVTGEVEMRVGDKFVTSVRENEFFGEMAILDDQPRSASGYAMGATTLAIITKARFMEMLQEDHDFALQIIRVLINRLRAETKMKEFW